MSLLSKECPTCGALQGTIAREAKHDTKASTASILSNGDSTMRELVATWRFSTHKKDGKPDSMCVTYEIDKLTAYREWICFEHGGFAEQKAAMWWVRHGGRSPAPRTVAEALERQAELTMPVEIRVKREGKYWRVA
jgi:DNA repair protein RadD